MFSEKYTVETIKNLIGSTNKGFNLPTYEEEDKWIQLHSDVKGSFLKEAEKYMNFSWPCLSATTFMEFKREGTRDKFQDIYFERRTVLTTMVIAECIERKGRYLDDIINGIWCICEESSWWIHAHNYMSEDGGKEPLPDIEEPIIDLFAAETSAVLAMTYFLIGKKLDKVSKIICNRIKLEINRRIIEPFITRDDYWWMGFVDKGIQISNWTTWCSMNCLITLNIMSPNIDILSRGIYKILRCLDKFIEINPSDGACMEGPGYWTCAGGSLFECIDILCNMTSGKIDFKKDKLISEIGEFIYRSHISRGYFINYSDSKIYMEHNPDIIYRFGKSIEDEQMILFAGNVFRNLRDKRNSMLGRDLYRTLKYALDYEEINELSGEYPVLRDVWLEESNYMAARENNSDTGFYLAAKGGHNDETHHNHNDVGNFIVYYDGKPVIIDVGSEPYTAKCFGNERYNVWYTQSTNHNLPIINGVPQKNGREYCASDVIYGSDLSKAFLSMNIAKAYPKTAGIKIWNRTLCLNRDPKAFIEITENYILDKPSNNVEIILMTLNKPELNQEYDLIIDGKFMIEYDKELYRVSYHRIDNVLLTDSIDHCYRIIFKTVKETTNCNFIIKLYRI